LNTSIKIYNKKVGCISYRFNYLYCTEIGMDSHYEAELSTGM